MPSTAPTREKADVMPRKPARAVAPWVRTRLRTAPGTALAYGMLVLVTAFLAAALPRAVDTYETEGMRHAVDSAPAHRTVVSLTNSVASSLPPAQQPTAYRPDRLKATRDQLTPLLPKPLQADLANSAYGARTTKRVQGLDRWLPQPDGLLPEFVLDALSDVPAHSTLVAGRAPKVGPGGAMEAAVTTKTAKAMGLKPGSVVHVPSSDGGRTPITVTGVIEPREPSGPYWNVDPVTHTPLFTARSALEVKWYWVATLLLGPESGTALPRTLGEPEQYWRYAPSVGHLTAQDSDTLRAALDSADAGPDLVALRSALGPNGQFDTDLDEVLGEYAGMRDAIAAVVAVAAVGVGAVAAVVLGMTGGLFTARRHAELALLRARGASLPGIGLRLLGETTVVCLPAAALGLLLAVPLVGDAGGARMGPAVIAAGASALLAALVLPLRAMFLHRRPLLHGGREDLVSARPSRRRTMAELTLLVLAVGAVTALRRRGTGVGAGDYLVSCAPVLVGVIAAFVLIRIYPVPLRWAARPARRLRGAIGFLSLARAGRASASGTLPLLALLMALTTAAFGGSVLAGVSDARDRAAYLATGADARITHDVGWTPLPAGLADTVRGFRGVREVSPVQIEYGLELPSHQGTTDNAMSAPLVGVEPSSYARLAARTDFGPFPETLLKTTGKGGPGSVGDTSRVVPAIASPDVAERLGDRPIEILAAAGRFHVKVVAVRTITPALPDEDFLIVNAADLVNRAPTALLVTGGGAGGGALDGTALRGEMTAKGGKLHVALRQEERSRYVDSPMQTGAENLYLAAIGAGAGYAVLAVLLSLLQVAPERTTLLARLRTMGLTRGQARRLLILEALPQALLAAGGGALVGWATVLLLAPGVDLARLALADAPAETLALGATLRADAWSLGLPAAGVVLLAGAAATVQAWWASRRGSIKELRAGDAR
ncbi:FtsX-like permease family protein [Streptomyces sp. NBC_01268]|uniref:FtsX-like permease family protein n=1 Tax=unclassified Streptomyces TaxID=2593676 RepID=UPI002E33BAC3|nr:FtsX-like permease family protein [Streptomyces sp. NBC_01268]